MHVCMHGKHFDQRQMKCIELEAPEDIGSMFNSILLVVKSGYRREKHVRVINCGETGWWNTKLLRGTPYSSMRPVST